MSARRGTHSQIGDQVGFAESEPVDFGMGRDFGCGHHPRGRFDESGDTGGVA